MKSEEKDIVVMIMTNPQGAPKTLKIRRSWLKFSAVTLSLISLSVLVTMLHYAILKSERAELANYKRLYINQKREIEELASVVSDISSELTTIGNYADKLKSIPGFKEGEVVEIEEVEGIGGEDDVEDSGGDAPDASIPGFDNEESEVLAKLERDIFELQNNAAIRKYDLKNILNVVIEKGVILAATTTIWPTSGLLTSKFGKRISPFTGRSVMHKGIDIANIEGTPVVAPADGEVEKTGLERGLGNMIRLVHENGIETLFAHLSRVAVGQGERVRRGDVIGYMGTTGRSTGPHLHFGVYQHGKPVNPLKYIMRDED